MSSALLPVGTLTGRLVYQVFFSLQQAVELQETTHDSLVPLHEGLPALQLLDTAVVRTKVESGPQKNRCMT